MIWPVCCSYVLTHVHPCGPGHPLPHERKVRFKFKSVEPLGKSHCLSSGWLCAQGYCARPIPQNQTNSLVILATCVRVCFIPLATATLAHSFEARAASRKGTYAKAGPMPHSSTPRFPLQAECLRRRPTNNRFWPHGSRWSSSLPAGKRRALP